MLLSGRIFVSSSIVFLVNLRKFPATARSSKVSFAAALPPPVAALLPVIAPNVA